MLHLFIVLNLVDQLLLMTSIMNVWVQLLLLILLKEWCVRILQSYWLLMSTLEVLITLRCKLINRLLDCWGSSYTFFLFELCLWVILSLRIPQKIWRLLVVLLNFVLWGIRILNVLGFVVLIALW